MNIENRRKIVSDGHIRSIYGGRKEPIFHLSAIFMIAGYLYIVRGFEALSSSAPMLLALSVLYIGSALSYFFVARIICLGDSDAEQFDKIKNHLDTRCTRKGIGKYYIEVYYNPGGSLSQDIHITAFLYNEKAYAAAWKYAGMGWHYVPFFSGKKLVPELRRVLYANK